jgi:methionyl-tRNA synthetase
MENKFYITTPIYYPSGKLHIGHAYSTVIADAQARYQKMLGKDVFFLTGTDEHGEKIQQKAQELNLSELDYLDGNISLIKQLWSDLDIDYDKFIRTTDANHVETIQAIFTKLLESGDIYLGEYSGWYSVPDESYYPINQIKDPIHNEKGEVIGGKSPDSDHPLQQIKEECYFFNIKRYASWLEEMLLSSEMLVPKIRVSEIVNSFLAGEVEDLAISRTSFNWGISINQNPKHVVYVWLDALFNYVTALGYNPQVTFEQQSENFKKFWPANVHIVGKEIIRFHGMYWPIFLKALDLPMPEKVYAHGWIMSDQGKMSKSKGNVIDPNMLIDLLGSDYLRLFLLNEYPLNTDGVFSYRNYLERYNTLLANDLGNMISRTSGMVISYLNANLEPIGYTNDMIKDLDELRIRTNQKYHQAMPIFEYRNAVQAVFELINQGNKLIDELKPWELNANGDKNLINQLLCLLHEIIVDVVAYLVPIMPNLASQTQNILQVENFDFKKQYKLEKTKMFVKNDPIFSRLKIDDVLKEIE